MISEKSDAQRRSENEKQNTERKLRMKHGKSWRQYTQDVLAAKQRNQTKLRPGEVRTPIKGKPGQYKSNKDKKPLLQRLLSK